MRAFTKKSKILIIVIAAVVAAAAIAVGGFFAGVEIAYNAAAEKLEVKSFEAGTDGDRIHFLNTASSDAIILESDGRFAMIDSGEDSDNPRNFPSLEAKGWEREILNYLKTRCMRDGKVTLEFILGTHAHSDHIGGFDTIVSDPDVVVKKAFLKPYNPKILSEYEKTEWDNQEVYDQMVDALNARGVEIVSDIPSEPFAFGNLTVRFVNNKPETELTDIGENDNTVGTVVSKGGVKAFLAGDMDNKSGDEAKIASEVGKVDLLKVGHHGYDYSTTWALLSKLKPAVAVACNVKGGVSPNVRLRLKIQKSVIMETGAFDGIIAEFAEGGFEMFGSIYEGVDRIS